VWVGATVLTASIYFTGSKWRLVYRSYLCQCRISNVVAVVTPPSGSRTYPATTWKASVGPSSNADSSKTPIPLSRGENQPGSASRTSSVAPTDSTLVLTTNATTHSLRSSHSRSPTSDSVAVQPSHSRSPSDTSFGSPSTLSRPTRPAPNVPISYVPPRPDIAPGLTFSSLLRVPPDIIIPDIRPEPRTSTDATPPTSPHATRAAPDATTTGPPTSGYSDLSLAPSIASSERPAASPKLPRQSKPSSWAELLKSPSPSTSPSTVLSPPLSSTSNKPVNVWSAVPASRSAPLPVKEKGSPRRSLEQALVGIEDQFSAPFLHPRGLINKGNLCFENSVSECPVQRATLHVPAWAS
jgi:hypothetical protein